MRRMLCSSILVHLPFIISTVHSEEKINSPGITAVMVDNIEMRDPFTEIGLDSVDAGIHQSMDQTNIPLASCRVCEINDSHSRLPFIPTISPCLPACHSPLPNAAVGSLEEVPVLDSVLEDIGSLGNIRVDPSADFDVVFLLELRQVFLGVGECLGVP